MDFKLIKIEKGQYQVQGTDWEICYDYSVEGTNKWVILNQCVWVLDVFLEENDQLWYTLGEAKEMLFDYLESRE